jgi:hypothetical protein
MVRVGSTGASAVFRMSTTIVGAFWATVGAFCEFCIGTTIVASVTSWT